VAKLRKSTEVALRDGRLTLDEWLCALWPWEPPASCIPENGLGLASLVDVYK
jgi:hypothetical protein